MGGIRPWSGRWRGRRSKGEEYPQSCELRMTAPSVEGAKEGFRLCGGEAVDGARLAAFRSPPVTPSGAYLLIAWYRGNSWQVAAALSAAVTTTKLIGDRPHSQGRASPKKETTQTPATLRERGSGREALLLEKAASLPEANKNDHRQVAAALSAAVTTTKLIGERPHSQGRASPKEETTQTPATLRERGAGGEALLLEKRHLPQNLRLP